MLLDMSKPTRKSKKTSPVVVNPVEAIKPAILDAARRLQAGRVAAFGTLRQIHAALPAGSTIGQLHDAVRELVAAGKVRLHPFTGSRYMMMEEGCEYALIMGCEIMLYVECR